ncbi:hypothetical protein CDD83_306 [Cordyceps sp. RAO-2017]|nr:hypothetical protein CDD83_306 [Cordyceps sp. RAO-2017]
MASARAAAPPWSHGGIAEKAKVTPPSRDPFYVVPAGVDKVPPGTILRHRGLPSPPVPLDETGRSFVEDSHQILYRTTDSRGNATATVLTVLIPSRPDYGKVVSFQVAEDAVTVDCAPSFGFQSASSDYPELNSLISQTQLLIAQAALQRGWVVVVPDYEGPEAIYPTGKLALHAILDGVRASLKSGTSTGIRENATVALWGYSSGGGVTLRSVQLQPSYAPELRLAGAAVGGVMGDLADAFSPFSTLDETPYAWLIPIAFLGAAIERPWLRELIDKHLKPGNRQHFYSAQHQCVDANRASFSGEDVMSMFDDPTFLLSIPEHVDESDIVVDVAPRIPVFWYQCAHDQLVNAAVTGRIAARYCSEGAKIEYRVETADFVDHLTYGLFGAPSALRWLQGIMTGEAPPPSGCSSETVLTQEMDAGFLNIFPEDIQKRILLAVNPGR